MIRPGEEKDLMRLVELGQAYHASTILKNMVDYDPESAGMLFLDCIEASHCILAVLEIDGQVEGYIMGAAVPLYFNRSALAAQMISWYVTPGKRGWGSLQLFDEWERWHQSKGAQLISVGGQAKIRVKAMDRLMKRYGYEPLETMHVKGVK